MTVLLSTKVDSSTVPRPRPKNRERGLVSLVNFPICAEPAYYTTHPNNHISYIIDLLCSSRGKCAKECYNWQWTNVIPLLQMKTADTAHTGTLAGDTRPLSRFLGGAWGRG